MDSEQYKTRRQQQLEKELKKRELEDREFHRSVIVHKPFREWLDRIADRYGYLGMPHERTAYDQGANDAVRAIINAFVKCSPEGAQWLADYAEKFSKETK